MRARRRKTASACDEFLDMGYLLFNRYSLEYRGHHSLGFALISYSKYKYKDVFEYLEDMKQYDLKMKNYKRLEEIKQIENLSEKEILNCVEMKYQQYCEQLTKEVAKELEIKNQRIGEVNYEH